MSLFEHLRGVLTPPPAPSGRSERAGDGAGSHRAGWRSGEVPARAAVALILRDLADPELLFIRRARSERDPWSGQIALPGGRIQAEDPDPVHAAVRETQEETGIRLDRTAGLLGGLPELSPLSPRLPRISIHPWVFRYRGDDPLSPDPREVSEAFWVPLSELRAPDTRRSAVRVQIPGGTLRHPAYVLQDRPGSEARVVWGLTFRILEEFFGRIP